MPNEIIEQPSNSEVYERLPEPDNSNFSSNYDEVRLWRSRISAARKIRDKKLEKLNTLLKMYAGEQWGDTPIDIGDYATINLIFSSIKEELPALYFQNPMPIVEALGMENEVAAFAMQELLKAYTKKNRGVELKRHVRLCMLDAKFTFGVAKTTYTPSFSQNPRAGKPVQAGNDALGNPLFLFNEEGQIIMEPNEILTSEQYYVERCSPREILIDSKCRNFPERAEWIGHEIVKPLKYLQDSQIYENTSNLKPNVQLKDVFKNIGKSDEGLVDLIKNDTDLVRFVEIYDLVNNKILVLPDNFDNFIRNGEFGLNPFSFLKYNEMPDEFYPVSDVEQLKPLQEEVNVGRSLMITHARRSARKYYYTENTFRGIDPQEGIEAMKSSNDMTLVKVAEYAEPPAPIVQATQDASVFMNLQQSRLDFNLVSGSTEAQRGMSERRKTRGEATYQEQHGAVRRGDKQSLVADFIVDIYTKLGMLMQKTLTIPQAVKIAGKDGVFWAVVKQGDIDGEFNYSIEVNDLRPSVPEIERQEISEFIFALSNFLNALAGNPIISMVFNPQGTIKEFAKSFPSINVNNILNPQFTMEQMAEMLMQQIQSGAQTNITNRTVNEGDVYE